MFNTVYISGKVTGMEEEAFKKFDEAEKLLVALDFNVVNPMKLPHNHDKTWDSYMRECLIHLMSCDKIYMLRNYEYSRGAVLELFIAKELGMLVAYEESDSNFLSFNK